MRILSIMTVSVFTLVLGASVVSMPTGHAVNVPAAESNAVDQLSAKRMSLPVELFDAFRKPGRHGQSQQHLAAASTAAFAAGRSRQPFPPIFMKLCIVTDIPSKAAAIQRQLGGIFEPYWVELHRIHDAVPAPYLVFDVDFTRSERAVRVKEWLSRKP